MILSHRPDSLSRGGRHRTQEDSLCRSLSRVDDPPCRAVVMLHEAVQKWVRGVGANRPHVVPGDGTHTRRQDWLARWSRRRGW